MGAFIVLEGGEGAGKSTAVAVIRDYLISKGVAPEDILETREPGGTEIAEKIRTILKEKNPHEQLTSEAELLLMYAARAQLVHRVIIPAVVQGKFVIGDRHDLSTVAYQGAGRGLPMEKIDAVRDIAIGDLKPDLTIVMDIEPEAGMRRARNRGDLDRFEVENIEFFRRIRNCFLNEAARHPDRIKVVDAGQDLEHVKQSITDILESSGICTAG